MKGVVVAMIKKWAIVLTVILVLTAIMATAAFALSGDIGATVSPSTQTATTEKTVLTEAQQVEVKGILAQIQALKEKLIDKYVGYGVITQERADTMKERMQERAAKAEENGYLPAFGRHGGMKGGKAGMREKFGRLCPKVLNNDTAESSPSITP